MKTISYYKLLHVFISAGLGMLLLCLFTACNTVHKTTQSQKVNTDSVHVIKSETEAISKHDSVILKETKGDYTRETVIEFDTSDHVGNEHIYTGTLMDNSPVYERYTSAKPFKKTIRETGNYQTKDQGKYNNFDSSASKQIDSAMKHQTVEVKNTDKKSSRMPIGLIIGGVVLLAIVAVAVIYKPKINV